MLRWNAVLVLLTVLLFLDAILIISRDLTFHVNNNDSILPTHKETHDRRKSRVDQLKDSTSIGTSPLHVSDNEVDEDEQNGEVENNKEATNDEEAEAQGDDSSQHKVAGLNCEAYGGPSQEEAAEMVYWQDIPSDSNYVSPLKATGPEIKYLTFEPDEGGWNNIRMSMETAVTLAHATGRILVMPPEQGMYLLESGHSQQKNRFSFGDFFHFDSVATEHAGVEVITMEEFLNREVMTGNAKDKETHKVTFPPNNRTKWDGAKRHEAKILDNWMRTFAENPKWPFDQCLLGLPAKPGSTNHLLEMAREVTQSSFEERRNKFNGNPGPVDGKPLDRLAEMFAHRRELCVYDEFYQNAKVLHMMGDNKSGSRLLVHFYAYLFFEDWKADLWNKRFVRDHLRYVDEIQCAAARVVNAMRKKAREHGNADGIFDTFHIRRGDFQYKDTRVEAHVIYSNMKHLVPEGTTIYIATDEKDKSFFKIFHEHFHVYFLDDFLLELKNVNTNFYGMLDQRVASRGRTFIGCFYSTFTGYINRMRGYHSQKDKAEGWEKGVINSWYYIPKDRIDALREYRPIAPAMWSREFPVAWRDLNKGIEEISMA